MCRSSNVSATNWMHFVLFGMRNRTFCPYLTAMKGILTSVMKQGCTMGALCTIPLPIRGLAGSWVLKALQWSPGPIFYPNLHARLLVAGLTSKQAADGTKPQGLLKPGLRPPRKPPKPPKP
jgi:hypothetical protein